MMKRGMVEKDESESEKGETFEGKKEISGRDAGDISIHYYIIICKRGLQHVTAC